MRTISVRINKEDERADPFDCPAKIAKANCVTCNYREGRVMVSWEEGATVRCCWEECMKMVRYKVIFESGKVVEVTTKTQAEALEYAEALRQNNNWGEVVALLAPPTKKTMITNERRKLVETN